MNEQPEEERPKADQPAEVYLKWIAADMKMIRSMLAKVVNYMVDAESEIPEKVRRFIMYMHDVHDIVNLYHENGQSCPRWVSQEIERCDDRFRQILDEMHKDGGTFERVRREMSKDPLNRWDHTRQLAKPQEPTQ